VLVFGFDLAAGAQRGPTLAEPDVARALNSPTARFLGAGTFGETWLFDDGPVPMVAKLLLDPNATAHQRRIQREIESLNRASSHHVVHLNDVRQVQLPAGPRVALIFEFIDGGDVQGRIERGEWPSPAELEGFALGLLRGLVELHSKEVVHRDIKPANVALRDGRWDQPVILDLGLGRILDASTITLYPASMGTPSYMAPEVVAGERARKGSDLWSLGVMLHLLGTKTHPFYPNPAERLAPDDAYDRLTAGLLASPAPVPAPLNGIICRLLEVEVHRRGSAHRSLTELLEGQRR